jgi:hypothetical protein
MTLIISKGLTLDNGTRAAAIAGVSPTLDYRFAREKREIETVSLTDKLTYTGGNGTFVGSDGFIQRATTNVPRFDHDPLSRRSLGLLSENSGQNLHTQSETLTDGYTVQGLTQSVQPIMAPTGKLGVLRLVEDTTTGVHRIFRAVVSPGANVVSLFVKNFQGSRTITFQSDTNLGRDSAIFDIVNKTVVLQTVGLGFTQANIVQYSNNWVRLIVSSPSTLSTNCLFLWALTAESGSYVGDGASGIYVFGAQVQPGSEIGTYIPTTSAAVTRTADSAVIDGTGVLTGTYTMVEKPAGCAVVSGTNIELQPGFTAERVMVFPAALDAGQITAIRGAM